MGVEIRPSQALRLWHDVTMELVTDGDKDLTARQMAILLTVYLEPPPHTVRGLAARLNVTKPVITRALDTLETGKPEVLEYGVTDAMAWEVGLACGGRIRVMVEPVTG